MAKGKKDKGPQAGLTIKVKTKGDGKKGKKAKKAKSEGLEKLAAFADHPLVGEVLAAGALAAVAAIAESGLASKTVKPDGKKSSKAIKDAGKAAATAIGLRLVTEFSDAVKKNQAK